MKYEDIKKANEQIKTMKIVRKNKTTGEVIAKDYVEVNQRIKAFRMVYPQGAIETEIVSGIDNIIGNSMVIIKATVSNTYTIVDSKNGTVEQQKLILGTGYAMEEKDSSLINKTSFIENCETSAIGRALGMCGFGIDTAVASYEEMKQVENTELHNRLQIQVQINKLLNAKGITPDAVLTQFNKKSSEMSDEELLEVVNWLEAK